MDQRQQFFDRCIEDDSFDVLALVASGQPLVMAVNHIAIVRHEDRAVATGIFGCAGDFRRGELRLCRLQGICRHFSFPVLDAASIEEIDHWAAMLGFHLRHLCTRNTQRAGVLRERLPLTVL